VEVAHAFHMEQVFVRNEDEKDFERAWRFQDERRKGRKIPKTCQVAQFLQYREIVMFSVQIERFFKMVPKGQRLVLFQKDLLHDTLGVYKQTLEFLGLPYDGRTDFERVNVAHFHRFEWLAQMVRRPPKFLQMPMLKFRWYLSNRKWPMVESLKAGLRVKSRRDPLSPEFYAELQDTFRPDLQRLERLIGRPLTKWQGHA
jgi:hypothetical protein